MIAKILAIRGNHAGRKNFETFHPKELQALGDCKCTNRNEEQSNVENCRWLEHEQFLEFHQLINKKGDLEFNFLNIS